MMNTSSTLLVVLVLASLCVSTLAGNGNGNGNDDHPGNGHGNHDAHWTALQEYVYKPDAHYHWEYMPQYNLVGQGFTAHMVNLTSQKWLDETKVNMPIWFHTLYVVVPDTIHPNFSANALNWVANHYNEPVPTDNLVDLGETNMMVAGYFAVHTQSIVTITYQVPNQRLIFAEDPLHKARREDENIAFGWSHFLNNPNDTEWLMRLPMTKAVVRSMDATEEFLAQHLNHTVNKWIVAGPSKRGWTSYTVAAAAPDRVIGFSSLVLDQADFKRVVEHQYKAYGGWSYAVNDYIVNNIFQRMDTPEFQLLTDIEAPFSYVSILKHIPKLILSVTGDEFGTPDDITLYWDRFGPNDKKAFRLMPNLDHSMEQDIVGVLDSLVSWMLLIQTNTARPVYDWSISDDGTLTVECDNDWAPTSVNLWQANTIDGNRRRDFRISQYNATTGQVVPHPVRFTSSPVTAVDRPGQGRDKKTTLYRARVDPPAEGWVGFFFELNYESIFGTTYKTNTGVSILPKTYPSEMCVGEACNGPFV